MKWILLLLVIAAGAYGYWAYMNAHPAMQACGKFADLCGQDSRKQCDDAFDGLSKAASADELTPSVKCIQGAKTCPQAAGCLAGAAGKAGLKAAGEFLKGLEESLQK